MNFYPAIDLKDGKCIRLKKGELKDITFYNPNPVDQASQFIEMGAKWIHMVDIEGAFKGKGSPRKPESYRMLCLLLSLAHFVGDICESNLLSPSLVESHMQDRMW